MLVFNVDRKQILRAVSYLSAIVELRNVDDVYSCIKIKASNSSSAIELMTTCTEMSVTYTINTDIKKNGEVAISAKVFSEIVKRLPDESHLRCSLQSSAMLSISSGSSLFSLATTDFESFPSIEHGESLGKVSIKASKLLVLLEKTKMCMSSDEMRYNLNGMAFDCKENSISCVATDGHRLAKATDSECTCSYDNHVIIPRKTVAELSKLLPECNDDSVEIDISARTIKVSLGPYVLISKLVDARFPNYDSIIPKGSIADFSFSSKDFVSTIERVSSVTHEKLKVVRLSILDGKLTIYSTHSAYGSASEELGVACNGENLEISFNVKFLTDALNCITSDFSCLCTGQASAMLIKDPNDSSVLYVIMPVRQ